MTLFTILCLRHMIKIINCCYPNLNQRNNANELLGDDVTTERSVGASPTLILPANANRRVIKIYCVQFSDPLAQLWLHHGSITNANNFAFPLLLKHLFVDTSQAARALSSFCSNGTALLRITEVNKL